MLCPWTLCQNIHLFKFNGFIAVHNLLTVNRGDIFDQNDLTCASHCRRSGRGLSSFNVHNENPFVNLFCCEYILSGYKTLCLFHVFVFNFEQVA